MRIGIIGLGWVGTSVAISLLHAGLPRTLLLHDINTELAEGEAMDLRHGASFYPTADVRTAELSELRECDAVVIAAGRGSRPGESRLALLRETGALARSLGRALAGARGLVVVVTNPVDVLTQIVAESSGLPPARVIGTGTMLDGARLRQAIGQRLRVDPRSVHAYVVGEHGDSEVVLWSSAHVGGTALRRWPGWRREDEAPVATEVRRAAYEIIRRKGATNHAIGLVTTALLRACLRDERRVVTVCRVQHGAAGLHDVALSLPTIVGQGGATDVVVPPLDDAEAEGLSRSAAVLRAARASIDAPAEADG
jgi:L-lactate dehydrogenase